MLLAEQYGYLGRFPGPQVDVNLYPNAMLSGIQAGNAQKTTTQSIFEGISSGVKSGLAAYQGVQAIQSNALALESQAAQTEIDTDPNVKQAKKDQIVAASAQQQAKAAEAQRADTQKIGLMDVLKSGIVDDIVGAFTGGQFSDALADPNFAKAAYSAASPYLPDDVAQVFIKNERSAQRQAYTQKQLEQTAQDFNKARADFQSSQMIADALDNNPGLTSFDLAKNAEVVPSKKYARDTKSGEVLRYTDIPNDPNYTEDVTKVGTPIVNPIDVQTEGEKTYDLIDRKTGKILSSNVDKDEVSKFRKYRSLATLHDSNLMDGPIAAGIKEGRGEPATVQNTGIKERDITPPPPQETPAVSLDTQAPPAEKITRPNPVLAQDTIKKLDVVQKSGYPNLVDNPKAITTFAASVGIPDVEAHTQDVNTALEFASIPKGTTIPNDQKLRYEQARKNLVDVSLTNQFESNKETLSKTYNTETVLAHNQQVDSVFNAMMNRSREINNPFSDIAGVDATLLVKVDSPETLFKLRQFSNTANILDSTVAAFRNRLTEQKVATIKKQGVPNQAKLYLKSFK